MTSYEARFEKTPRLPRMAPRVGRGWIRRGRRRRVTDTSRQDVWGMDLGTLLSVRERGILGACSEVIDDYDRNTAGNRRKDAEKLHQRPMEWLRWGRIAGDEPSYRRNHGTCSASHPCRRRS